MADICNNFMLFRSVCSEWVVWAVVCDGGAAEMMSMCFNKHGVSDDTDAFFFRAVGLFLCDDVMM